MSLTEVRQTDRAPSFEALDEEVSGIVANARVAFALTTIERACEHGEWDRALDSAAGLAETIASAGASAAAWRELLSAAALFAVRADRVAALRPIFEEYAERAWRDDEPQSMPWQLADALDEADRLGRTEAGLVIARLCTQASPTCPLGPMARGHFSERLLPVEPSEARSPERIADDFEEAADLAVAIAMPNTAARCRLRAGVLLLATGAGLERGRRLLRTVDPDEFERGEALWYAIGMTHSSFWLDRVRASDAVSIVHEADATEVPALDTRSAARHLIECAPVELEALEIDRLRALIDEIVGQVSDDPEEARAPLELREQLAGLASAPVTEADVAADILSHSTVGAREPARDAALEFCRAAARAAESDDSSVPAESLERIAQHLPVAASALEVVSLCGDKSAERLATRLGELEGQLRTRGGHASVDELASLALIWDPLLRFVDQIRMNSTDVERTTLRRIAASTAEILRRFIEHASAPSYGWWALAANLLATGFEDEATLAARRAIDDGEHVDQSLEHRVLAAVVDHAIKEGNPDEIRRWLEIAEGRLDSGGGEPD